MPRNGVAEERHGARVGVGQSQEYPNQRGLPRTVWPQVAKCAASRNTQVDTVDGDVRPEPLGQSVGLHRPLGLRALAVGSRVMQRNIHQALTLIAVLGVVGRQAQRRGPGAQFWLPQRMTSTRFTIDSLPPAWNPASQPCAVGKAPATAGASVRKQ